MRDVAGVLNGLFSVYGWTIWVLHLLLAGPLVLLAVSVSPRRAFPLLKLFCRSALGMAGIRVRVRGLAHVDPTRQYVFMGNHPSMLDPFYVAIALPRFAVGIEKAQNFQIPVYGLIVRRWGNIPVHKDDPRRARDAIATAIERFRQGTSIALLPEGTRSWDGRLGPFKKGGFHLAIETGATLMPFTITGAFPRFRRGSWRIHPGTVEVQFGEPLSTQGYTKDRLNDLVAEVRRRIEAPLAPDEKPLVTA